MNFGLFYADNIWHVLKKNITHENYDLVTSCNDIYITSLKHKNSMYPIDMLNQYQQFSYKSLCKSCQKKHNLTKADIIQHIINVKLGVKIEDLV